MAAALFVHVVTGVGKLLTEYCEYITALIDEKKRIITNKDDHAVQDKYQQIISLYNESWKQFSAGLANIDLNLAGVNSLVNKIYAAIDIDADEE